VHDAIACCSEGQTAIAKPPLERGVDLECKNKYGETPLSQAATS
jgi:hypothetical protein